MVCRRKPIPHLELDELITRLVNTDDADEVRRLYQQWAESYDSDLEKFGYVAPQIGVKIFSDLIKDPDALVHDAGCGTGQVGQLLNQAGYKNLIGSDFSADMLGVAKSRECYRSLMQADYTKPLEFESEYVDAVISIGVYTKRFKNHFLKEMMRILKPGGWMVFSCRPLYFEEVAGSLKDLHTSLQVIKSSVAFDDYMIGQKACAYYVALQKVSADRKQTLPNTR